MLACEARVVSCAARVDGDADFTRGRRWTQDHYVIFNGISSMAATKEACAVPHTAAAGAAILGRGKEYKRDWSRLASGSGGGAERI
eukprot:1661146-Pyramimonas_sp.AAC.1